MKEGAIPASLVARIAALVTVLVFVQVGVISEVPVFGVTIDVSPLLVAFVGLCAAPRSGRSPASPWAC